jgi:hypothetical protein
MKSRLFAEIIKLNEIEAETGENKAAERTVLRAALANILAEECLNDVEPDAEVTYKQWVAKTQEQQIAAYHAGFNCVPMGQAKYFTTMMDDEVITPKKKKRKKKE